MHFAVFVINHSAAVGVFKAAGDVIGGVKCPSVAADVIDFEVFDVIEEVLGDISRKKPGQPRKQSGRHYKCKPFLFKLFLIIRQGVIQGIITARINIMDSLPQGRNGYPVQDAPGRPGTVDDDVASPAKGIQGVWVIDVHHSCANPGSQISSRLIGFSYAPPADHNIITSCFNKVLRCFKANSPITADNAYSLICHLSHRTPELSSSDKRFVRHSLTQLRQTFINTASSDKVMSSIEPVYPISQLFCMCLYEHMATGNFFKHASFKHIPPFLYMDFDIFLFFEFSDQNQSRR